jgi:hypothetical protein
VKILRFEIEGENIGQQRIEHAGKILDLLAIETVGNVDFGGLAGFVGMCRHRVKLLGAGRRRDRFAATVSTTPASEFDAQEREWVFYKVPAAHCSGPQPAWFRCDVDRTEAHFSLWLEEGAGGNRRARGSIPVRIS